MVVKCDHCRMKFEVVDPVRLSTMAKVKRMVPCAECGEINYVLWPKDLHPVPRKHPAEMIYEYKKARNFNLKYLRATAFAIIALLLALFVWIKPFTLK